MACGDNPSGSGDFPSPSVLWGEFTGDTSSTPELPSNRRSLSAVNFEIVEGTREGAAKGPYCRVTLSWTACPDDDFSDYSLYRATSPGISGQGEPALAAQHRLFSDTVYDDDFVTWDQNYYYALRTTDSDDNYSWSNEIMVTTPSLSSEPPQASVLAADTTFYRYVELSWSRCTEIDFMEYELFVSPVPGLVEETVAGYLIGSFTATTDTTWLDTDFDAQDTMYFAVKTWDVGGQYSWSNEIEVPFLTFAPAVIDSLDIGMNPEQMVLLPGTGRIYVTNCTSGGGVKVVDTQSFSVTGSVQVPGIPFGICSSPNEDYVYVTLPMNNSVAVLDVSSNTIIDSVTVPGRPMGICSSPDGASLYVSCFDSDDVKVIRTLDNTLIDSVGVGADPWGISCDSYGERLIVANTYTNTVSVIDASSVSLLRSFSVGAYPVSTVFSRNGTRAWVSCWESGQVYEIDVEGLYATGYFDVDGNPGMLDTDSDGFVIVPEEGYGETSIFYPFASEIIQDFPVGTSPWFVESHPDQRILYIADYLDGKLYLVNERAQGTSRIGSSAGFSRVHPSRHIQAAEGMI